MAQFWPKCKSELLTSVWALVYHLGSWFNLLQSIIHVCKEIHVKSGYYKLNFVLEKIFKPSHSTLILPSCYLSWKGGGGLGHQLNYLLLGRLNASLTDSSSLWEP